MEGLREAIPIPDHGRITIAACLAQAQSGTRPPSEAPYCAEGQSIRPDERCLSLSQRLLCPTAMATRARHADAQAGKVARSQPARPEGQSKAGPDTNWPTVDAGAPMPA